MEPKATILLVEDNLEHLHLTRHILKRNGVEEDLRVARDGQEALDYLYQRHRFQDPAKNPRPALVLLDLNIPRIDGKEVLRRMKQDPALSDIPVVVVSSSTRPEDVEFAQQQGASAYFSKSAGFEKLSEQLATIGQFIAGRQHP
jgi:CheY-like chemotaxis protein